METLIFYTWLLVHVDWKKMMIGKLSTPPLNNFIIKSKPNHFFNAGKIYR